MVYRFDVCIFDEEIDIEDMYVVVVKYDGGVFLSYLIIFLVLYEGYWLMINGIKGCIELNEFYEFFRILFVFFE